MRKLALFALILALVTPVGALAGKPGKKKHKDKQVEVVVVFGQPEREAARRYFVDKHGRGKCPPGLAKKHNGCLPPGLAKKRYAVGQRLPPEVTCDDLPWELSVKIGPAPDGYRYGLVDGDLVKLAVGTLLVVDAIQGLVE